MRHLRREKRKSMLAEWALEKPPPSRSKEYPAALKRWKAAMAERERAVDAALERIGWNPFRHYAQFVPRDRRDSEIDKL